jgi:hypothetical protein
VRALSVAHPQGKRPNIVATAIARELSAFIRAREVVGSHGTVN